MGGVAAHLGDLILELGDDLFEFLGLLDPLEELLFVFDAGVDEQVVDLFAKAHLLLAHLIEPALDRLQAHLMDAGTLEIGEVLEQHPGDHAEADHVDRGHLAQRVVHGDGGRQRRQPHGQPRPEQRDHPRAIGQLAVDVAPLFFLLGEQTVELVVELGIALVALGEQREIIVGERAQLQLVELLAGLLEFLLDARALPQRRALLLESRPRCS